MVEHHIDIVGAASSILAARTTMNEQLIVSPEDAGQRLDVFCVQHLPTHSRAALQKAIKEGQIRVNDRQVKPRYTVAVGDTVTVAIATPAVAAVPAGVLPTIEILYGDRDVMVINKPAGLVVHAGQAQEAQSVVAWAVDRDAEMAKVGDDPSRPGIVHRLDKDTSGVLILAKNQKAFEHLKEQFARRRAHKEYLALVFGVPGESKGRINRALLRSKRNPLRRTIDPAGKEAITEWRLEEKFGPAAGLGSRNEQYALLRVYPLTGRMHQIRVHLHFLGFPIVGDAVYTFKRQRQPQGVVRHMLHAEKLTLTLPSGKRATFTAPLPADFTRVIESLRPGQVSPTPLPQ